jgi:hypothetical protein
MARSVADIGLCKSTMGSPRLIESARRSCASATGPEDQSGDDRGDAGGGGVVGRLRAGHPFDSRVRIPPGALVRRFSLEYDSMRLRI